MAGPFTLPGDIDEGDYIEVDNMGAYSVSMRTGFNHFNNYEQVIVDTIPEFSLYQGKTGHDQLRYDSASRRQGQDIEQGEQA